MELDEILGAALVFGDLEDAVEQDIGQRQVLKMQNPFTLSETKFRKCFRLSKDLVHEVVNMVTPFIEAPSRSSAISVERKVLITLRFFAHGSYQEITGTNSYTAVSQATVSRSVDEVCNALLQPEIFHQWVHFPRNLQQLNTLRTRFYEKYRFPGVIGCIDCTHVAIVTPPGNDPLHPEHVYVNRNNYHSINVQLICDDNLKVMNVNARFPGSTHDSHIWRESEVSNTMEQIYRRYQGNTFFLLGDSGYPLRPWLLTPLRNPEPGTPQDRFNNALMSIRCSSERCNGVLKNRFRCLLRHRVLHYSPEKAAKIVNACVVLHNMCLEHNIPEPEIDLEMEQADFGMNVPLQNVVEDNAGGRVNPDLVAARRLQQHIAEHYYL